MIEESVIESTSIESTSLAESVRSLIKSYFETVENKNEITNLHQMVLEAIEPPMLRAVMEKCKYNQSRAAQLLGISRGTCRSMLIKYFDTHYCSRRETTDEE